MKDIDPDNTIMSTYISDARIAYNGTGAVNSRHATTHPRAA